MSKETTNNGANYNLLAQGTKVKGVIETESSDFRLDGVLEGTMICGGKVIVGQQGFLDGEVHCKNLEVLGRVNGTLVEVSEKLSLKADSVIEGNVKTKILEVEAGAVFNGTCDMSKSNG